MILEEIIQIVILTSVITTASTYVIVSRAMTDAKKSLYSKIEKIEINLNKAFIRIGILETKLN